MRTTARWVLPKAVRSDWYPEDLSLRSGQLAARKSCERVAGRPVRKQPWVGDTANAPSSNSDRKTRLLGLPKVSRSVNQRVRNSRGSVT
jgi:hypothetical protein